jgi:hypothetical protein
MPEKPYAKMINVERLDNRINPYTLHEDIYRVKLQVILVT